MLSAQYLRLKLWNWQRFSQRGTVREGSSSFFLFLGIPKALDPLRWFEVLIFFEKIVTETRKYLEYSKGFCFNPIWPVFELKRLILWYLYFLELWSRSHDTGLHQRSQTSTKFFLITGPFLRLSLGPYLDCHILTLFFPQQHSAVSASRRGQCY